jgi:hypothetical protein
MLKKKLVFGFVFVSLVFLLSYVLAGEDILGVSSVTNTYYVEAGVDDWDSYPGTSRYTGTTIQASDNKEISPNFVRKAYANVDTSGVPDDDVISSASVKFDEVSYYASKGVRTKNYKVYIDNSGAWVSLGTLTFGASAVVRTIVLDSTQRGYINKTGDTKFRFITTPEMASGSAVTLTIKAYETAQANACRMEITHAPAVSDSCSDCDGTDDCVIQCSDYCNLSENINMNEHEIHFNGTGTFPASMQINITGHISNSSNIKLYNKCWVRVQNGGILG